MSTCQHSTVARTVAPESWPWREFGNHRAIVHVEAAAPVVRACIAWQRRDRHPEGTGVRVVCLADGQEVTNVRPGQFERYCGALFFEAHVAGDYAVYYLPFELGGKHMYTPHVKPRPAEYAPTPEWVVLASAPGGEFPEGTVTEIQARTDMERFDPMELIACDGDLAELRMRCSGLPFAVFPEDRSRPIRMTDDVPAHWAQARPESPSFHGTAQPNEYYAFQLGLYGLQPLTGVSLEFGDLRNAGGDYIPSESFTCFNLGGVDWRGMPFAKAVTVAAGSVQPLWIGIDLPASAQGSYTGSVQVAAAGVAPQSVALTLDVSGEALVDRGDSELWKHSRLRWLNSTIGLDDQPAAGYPPVVADGSEATLLGRRVGFGPTGLPERVASFFTPSVDTLQDTPVEILARPMALVAVTATGPVQWTGAGVELKRAGSGAIIARASSASTSDSSLPSGLSMDAFTRLEFDGHMDCRVQVRAEDDIDLSDLALEIPMRREVAEYMMGMGRKGGYRPTEWHYAWDADRANHYLWLGTVNAGLHLKLKHDADVWDLYNLKSSGFPAGWYNEGRGGCEVVERGEAEVVIRAFCGPTRLKAGETVSLRFSLMVTPLKRLDLDAHWQQRYHHIDCWDGRKPDLEEARRVGATVVNLHQGGMLNPYINYPFKCAREMKAEADAAHAAGLKYKLYYTVRELSHQATEIWAFRSLNGEIYQEGGKATITDQFTMAQEQDVVAGGSGGPWLREHLVDRFVSAWHANLPDGELDQAIATAGLSRLHNHYLEGLAWLIRELGMDGIYLDGVGYDRQITKRLRKAMDRARPGCLIDFHSGNNFHPEYGLNNVLGGYMELLPFVDSLWIGEGFDYNESPDYYMTEICGIPFGLTNDMLQGGGNPWRGMVYGMTCRYGWQQGGDPQYLWQLWRDFGIADSRMLGYWVPDCPVSTDHPELLCTAYVKDDGTTLIALASWAQVEVTCRLKVDWARLGLREVDACLTAPPIPMLQEGGDLPRGGPLTVEPGKGWLLVLSGTPQR